MKSLTLGRIRAARAVAFVADVLQIVLFPLLSEGFVSPADDALDVVVCLLLTMLVGWHFSFLPSFIVKVVPLADLVPTWSIAVFLATRQKGSSTVIVPPIYDPPGVPPRISLPTDRRIN